MLKLFFSVQQIWRYTWKITFPYGTYKEWWVEYVSDAFYLILYTLKKYIYSTFREKSRPGCCGPVKSKCERAEGINICTLTKGKIVCGKECSKMIERLKILQRRREKKKRSGTKQNRRKSINRKQKIAKIKNISKLIKRLEMLQMRKEKEKRSRKRKKVNKRHNSWEDLSSSSLEEIFSSEDFSEEEIIKGEKGVEIEKGEKLSNKQLKMLVQAATEEKKASGNPLCRDITSLHRSSVSDIFHLNQRNWEELLTRSKQTFLAQ